MTAHNDAPATEQDERAVFLDRLQVVEAATLLEVGSDSGYFTAAGLQVTAGELHDHADRSFDAVFAIHALPAADLDGSLQVVRGMLPPGGLLFVGLSSPEQIFPYVQKHFDLIDVHTVDEFQAVTAVRPLD